MTDADTFTITRVLVPLETVSLDVRVGGLLKAVMFVPDGPRIDWEGEYTEVDRPNRLVFTLTDNPGEYPGVPIVVTFTEIANADATTSTEVIIAQAVGDFPQEQVDATIAGYNSFFDTMETVVAGMR
jgi:uncharacterized protein YndB with AHSA1/START domain